MIKWAWTLAGDQVTASPNAMVHAFLDSGTLMAESAGDAIERLLTSGPWDLLDQRQPITLVVSPVKE